MRDRDLVRLYWPVELRPAFDALFAIDDVMADIVRTSTQPALGEIRLAWWREALERLDVSPPPAEPRLQAVARELLARGVKGADVAAIEEGWRGVLDEDRPSALQRGAYLMGILKCLLKTDGDDVTNPGMVWSAADTARRLGDARWLDDAEGALDVLRSPYRFESQSRAWSALAALAARDVRRGAAYPEPEATPGRAWTLIRHRMTGRV